MSEQSELKKALEKARKSKGLLGFDLEVVLNEFKQDILASIPVVDADAIAARATEKAIVHVSTQIAGKLEEAIAAINKSTGTVDTDSIAAGVARIMQPTIQDYVNKVFQANAKALVDQVNARMEEKMTDLRSEPAGASGGQQGRGFSLLDLLGNPEILQNIKGIIEVFRPPAPSTDVATLVRGMMMGEKIAKGQMSIAEYAAALGVSPNGAQKP